MKYETEEPTGHLPTLCHLAPEPGESGESTCNHNVVVAGWFIVLPMDLRSDVPLDQHPGPPPVLQWAGFSGGWVRCDLATGWIEYGMECTQNVGRWEAIEIDHEWESRNVSLADVLKDRRVWIYEQEVWDGVEATHSRQCQKPL